MLDVIEYGISAAYSCGIRKASGPCVRKGNIPKYSRIFDDIRFNIHDGRRHNRIPARTRIQSNMYRILLEYGSNIDLRENDPTFERKLHPTPTTPSQWAGSIRYNSFPLSHAHSSHLLLCRTSSQRHGTATEHNSSCVPSDTCAFTGAPLSLIHI